MRAVLRVAHERAHRALRVVVLAAREAVVDDEDRAALEALAERAHPRLAGQADLAVIGRRNVDGFRVLEHRTARRPVCPCQVHGYAALDDAVLAPAHRVHRQRVDHLVCQHDSIPLPG